MYEPVCKSLLEQGVRLIYTTSKAVGNALSSLQGEFPFMNSQVSLNEKIAYELALAGGYASKRRACIFSTDGLYDALDPIMSSAYTGAIGGLVVVCIQETEEEITPVGPLSKLPVIAAEGMDALAKAVRFGYLISEKYEIPVIIQAMPNETVPGSGRQDQGSNADDQSSASQFRVQNSQFARDPSRRAATPEFRYELHRQLNEKIDRIREEFEAYEGNVVTKKGRTGIITYKRDSSEFFDDDVSTLYLATIFPLPERLVNDFLADVDEVFMAEGPYPAIRLQIPDRSKIIAEPSLGTRKESKPEEIMYGFTVVRETLGQASSINMAHGMKRLDSERKILATVFEDYFFHSGMPAVVNALCNGSSFVLLVMGCRREAEVQRILEGCGCRNFFHIDKPSDIEHFKDTREFTVLFYKGII
jgi:TPP-dependent indolepyruvate ferredoxin oxidoreductase alpha subunit